ncbi:DNA-binding response regulator [candidate division LCP-89 bacterium B3_LCP]|uniref:DNA-binding response regulator n=1 Tax=candidate division LCP-89 bacterium B3_LCP TaxID=2012998 RepID=A0A532V0G0_UNCL8|nr:MAG: DNA-binding response regulator [candidate division LCP-89 bacterium B3_LCP]
MLLRYVINQVADMTIPNPSPHLLIADDDPEVLTLLSDIFDGNGYQATSVRWGNAAYKTLRAEQVDLLLTDLKMPDLDGFKLLELMQKEQPELPVLVITGSKSTQDAVRAIKQGAIDYVEKPFNVDNLLVTVQNALEVGRLRKESRLLAEELAKPYRFENIVGEDERMLGIYDLVQDVAGTNTSALIIGESGTGKELIAQAIHYNSSRNRRPLVKVNCVTLSESLLESELFGHEKGAFTGAIGTKKGLFEIADGGTLFLDEIGEMSLSTQVKLLQFLQDNTFRRVGGTQDLNVDVRVIAATNRDLKKMVDEGTYREDLYYRLHVFPIQMPPLRERGGDISKLARFFVQKFSQEMGKRIQGFKPDAMRLLEAHAWPGNVRELENAIERAVVLCKAEWVDEKILAFLDPEDSTLTFGSNFHIPRTDGPLQEQVDAFEKSVLEDVLSECNGNRSQAARKLAINRTTLLAKIKKYNLGDEVPELCEV